MATLATAYSKVFAKDAAGHSSVSRSNTVKPLRAFANEDIYFYVKRIDNSRVVRAGGPARRWSLLEDDRLGGRGRAAADRRAAA